jgi:cytoskeletal protein CcmA (bactofilin family)
MLGKAKAKTKTQHTPIDTLIGADTTLTGDVRFRGGLHVDGEVVGNVVGEADGHTLFSISASGRIEGSVEAAEVVVNGAVDGDVVAAERVELGPTARVTGNVVYGLIQMAVGAEVNGKLVHQALPIVNAGSEKAGSEKEEAPGSGEPALPEAGDDVVRPSQ